jgi:PleD family two-component response regulator
MFFQGKEALHGSKMGLGLGLAVAKILVDLHDGIIEAHSAGRRQGAEFIVRLPLVAHMPTASQPEARRVLVVDDNQDHRELLAQLLRGRDYEVIEAHDAHEALQLTSSQSPTLVLSTSVSPTWMDMNSHAGCARYQQLVMPA